VTVSNQEIYATVERDNWAHRTGLIPAERFLIERYLEPSGRTLEAGTGSGRLLFAMQARGFSSLAGFDFVPELLAEARKRDSSGRIRFDVQNAASLGYGDGAFDQLVYLQQVLCFIEEEGSRRAAVREAYRVLRAGGIGLFSFLSFEARRRRPLYRAYLAYLRIVRAMRRSTRPLQSLPWLRLAGRFNPRALADAGPYVYWYRLEEICRVLADVGFAIDAIGSTRQILAARMPASLAELRGEPIEGMLYIVARK
jgi:SAM-dependent methyltransferase